MNVGKSASSTHVTKPSFEEEVQTSISKIKQAINPEVQPEWSLEPALPDPEEMDFQPGKIPVVDQVAASEAPAIKGTRPATVYRRSAKKLLPLTNKYLSESKSARAKGNKNRAEELMSFHEARVQNASAKIWSIMGRPVSRYQMMLHIVEEVSRGKLLSQFCGTEGYPTRATVIAWKEEHPNFKKAMDLAMKVQAECFADKALQEMLDEEEPKRAVLVKNRHDALMKRAALQNPEFRERQAAPPEPPEPTDIVAMQKQLLELIQADPTILPPGVAEAVKQALEGRPAGLTITLASED